MWKIFIMLTSTDPIYISNRMRIIYSSLIPLLSSFLIVSSSQAKSEQKFDAICLPGKNKCKVYLSPTELRIDEKGIIKSTPVNQITSWNLGGKGTKSDVGKVFFAPLFPPAALGIFTSSHEYIFTISFIDSEGIATFKSIVFRNKKPADRFAPYLGSITGLANGSFTNKPQNNFNRKEVTLISNNLAFHLKKSSIYSYTSNCEFYAPYTCLSFPRFRPILDK